MRGEYEALFESGGRARGAVKRHAGRSPDELAQLAHESGFIDEADPALLKEALERDLAGDKAFDCGGPLRAQAGFGNRARVSALGRGRRGQLL